jgi:hypothetical protein
VEGSSPGLTVSTVLIFSWRGRDKPGKTFVTTVVVPVEIRTWDFPGYTSEALPLSRSVLVGVVPLFQLDSDYSRTHYPLKFHHVTGLLAGYSLHTIVIIMTT